VEKRRPITEDDILLTELLLARSYGRLKQSVVQASSDAVGSLGATVGGTIRKHPYATAGAAVGAGAILYGLFRLMNREPARGHSDKKTSLRADMTMEVISLLAPVVMPYVTAYLEGYLKKPHSRDRR